MTNDKNRKVSMHLFASKFGLKSRNKRNASLVFGDGCGIKMCDPSPLSQFVPRSDNLVYSCNFFVYLFCKPFLIFILFYFMLFDLPEWRLKIYNILIRNKKSNTIFWQKQYFLACQLVRRKIPSSFSNRPNYTSGYSDKPEK